ncbi:hypothetical protein D3C76_1273330 [compost metagenome]
MSTDRNDEGNLREYDLERAAYKAVDLLLPEKEPLRLTPKGIVAGAVVAAISCGFFGAMAFIVGARDQWLLLWVAVGAIFILGAFLNGAYRPFHNLDRAWRYLCLRCSTQVGWLILGLLVYSLWR